uniref:Uncharacterized protein n=1 Tax=Sinocyclocheilus anshuiensis TaxID=1608454 RepID=A0A671QIV8_9TELE
MRRVRFTLVFAGGRPILRRLCQDGDALETNLNEIKSTPFTAY